MNWPLIETAKKGERIVGAWNIDGRWFFEECFWDTLEDAWVGCGSDHLHSPSHWMPLPKSEYFAGHIDMVRKAEKDKTLSLVLQYFYDDVLNSQTPKIGVKKIIEELCKKVGDRKKLAGLVGESEEYVNEILQACQDENK